VQQQAAAPALGADVSPLALRVENVDSRTLRVRIGAEGRWEVPRALLLGTTESAPAPARSLSHVQAQPDFQVLWGARFEQPAAWPWPAACQRARLARAPLALPTPLSVLCHFSPQASAGGWCACACCEALLCSIGHAGSHVRGPCAGSDDAVPQYQFNYKASPFAFAVARRNASDGVPLFSTQGTRLVFKVRLCLQSPLKLFAAPSICMECSTCVLLAYEVHL